MHTMGVDTHVCATTISHMLIIRVSQAANNTRIEVPQPRHVQCLYSVPLGAGCYLCTESKSTGMVCDL